MESTGGLLEFDLASSFPARSARFLDEADLDRDGLVTFQEPWASEWPASQTPGWEWSSNRRCPF